MVSNPWILPIGLHLTEFPSQNEGSGIRTQQQSIVFRTGQPFFQVEDPSNHTWFPEDFSSHPPPPSLPSSFTFFFSSHEFSAVRRHLTQSFFLLSFYFYYFFFHSPFIPPCTLVILLLSLLFSEVSHVLTRRSLAVTGSLFFDLSPPLPPTHPLLSPPLTLTLTQPSQTHLTVTVTLDNCSMLTYSWSCMLLNTDCFTGWLVGLLLTASGVTLLWRLNWSKPWQHTNCFVTQLSVG